MVKVNKINQDSRDYLWCGDLMIFALPPSAVQDLACAPSRWFKTCAEKAFDGYVNMVQTNMKTLDKLAREKIGAKCEINHDTLVDTLLSEPKKTRVIDYAHKSEDFPGKH